MENSPKNKIILFFRLTDGMEFKSKINLLNKQKFTYKEVNTVSDILYKKHLKHNVRKTTKDITMSLPQDRDIKWIEESFLHISHIEKGRITDLGYASEDYLKSNPEKIDCVDTTGWSDEKFFNSYKLGGVTNDDYNLIVFPNEDKTIH